MSDESKDEGMTKLGVDETQKDPQKVATEGCPECGKKLVKHGNVVLCPDHGSEPFEGK